MRILIVEDDSVISALIRKGLERERFEIDEAADGPTGLRMAQSGSYSLMILDVMLPSLDGWEAQLILSKTLLYRPVKGPEKR